MNQVAMFPTLFACPACGRSSCEEDLSECLTCGKQYCSKCDWSCDCDKVVADIGTRLREQLRSGRDRDEGVQRVVQTASDALARRAKLLSVGLARLVSGEIDVE